MTCYLDSAATTQPKFFAKDYNQMWFNSNTNYAFTEQRMLEGARETIKECLGVKTGKVLFCRCATEAVEWLCRKIHHYSNWGDEIIFYSPYEHDSVVQASEVATDAKEKKINEQPQDVDDNLREGDIYLHQYVNQLTGTIFDIESIGKQVQSTGAYFGSDFTAAIGHTPLLKNLDTFCDAVWFSGHKFNCEKGIGAIWISDRLFELFGGKEDSKNEYGLIHGTVNVASAIAMSCAMKDACENVEENNDKYNELVWHFCSEMVKYRYAFKFANKGSCLDFTCAINSIILPEINADALQVYLASKGIYISIGASACADTEDRYRVLESFGLTNEECESTIRISFCENTNYDDIDNLVREIKNFKEMF